MSNEYHFENEYILAKNKKRIMTKTIQWFYKNSLAFFIDNISLSIFCLTRIPNQHVFRLKGIQNHFWLKIMKYLFCLTRIHNPSCLTRIHNSILIDKSYYPFCLTRIHCPFLTIIYNLLSLIRIHKLLCF